ncbi:hypothetical protein EUP80_24985 [Salmonella enterica subsp. enterica serovar Bredeney]|nr:hypothetical protein [Salmonella enterica subsp. enterica serovar Bredeney]
MYPLQKRKSPTELTAGLEFIWSTIEAMATISDLHKKAPTKFRARGYTKNIELPVMELRCRVPPGDFVNGENEAVCALEDHEGSAPFTPHRTDEIHRNGNRVITAKASSQSRCVTVAA